MINIMKILLFNANTGSNAPIKKYRNNSTNG